MSKLLKEFFPYYNGDGFDGEQASIRADENATVSLIKYTQSKSERELLKYINYNTYYT